MERWIAKCVVLGAVDTGEADRIVSLFSEESGRLSAFASAARKSTKRFGGALEPFTLINAALVERHGDLFRFERAEILEPFTGIRGDLGGISRGALACELVGAVCRDREPHPELFAELVDLLFRLSRGGGAPEDLLAFELTALAWAGLRPALDDCTGCGAAPSPDDFFDPDRGGVLCPACTLKVPGARALAWEVAEALRDFQRGDRGLLASTIRAEARAHLERFIAYHVGRPLKSAAFMRSLGMD